MKTISTYFNLILFSTLLLFSCSENNKENSSVNTSNENQTEDSTEVDIKHDSSTEDVIIEEEVGEYDYDIIDNWLKLGLDQSIVVERLGEPESKGKDIEWGALGTYVQQWRYDSKGIVLEMESEKENENKHVLMITLQSPSKGKTSKMISIGSNVEEVKNAYKELISEESIAGKSIIVGSVYGGAIFMLENNKVKSIFIGAAAE